MAQVSSATSVISAPSTSNTTDIDPSSLKLSRNWKFWFFNTQNYNAQLKSTKIISDVKNFWCHFNNIPQISCLNGTVSYTLMVDAFEPSWEKNLDGGTVRYSLYSCDLDALWLDLLLLMIGHTEDVVNDVLIGASMRPSTKFCAALTLWVNSEPSEDFYNVLSANIKSLQKYKHAFLSNKMRADNKTPIHPKNSTFAKK